MDQRDKLYDEWLVAASQAGDAGALDELVRRWHPRLVRQACALTGDGEAARDVAQESWMAMVRGLDRLDDPVAFPAWAFRVLHGKAIDWIRKQQRRRKRDRTFEELANAPPPSSRADGKDVALEAALETLPPERRALVGLFYYEQLSVAEIADVLGISPGTVKSRLYHCRHQLRRHMEESTP
jgi:RNA polymerase sigma-70 factor (ECF subfamily)